MMKNLLMIMALLLAAVSGFAQAELTITAPTGASTTGLRAPNGTTAHTTMRGVIIVTAAELSAIPVGTPLTKLGFVLSAGATPGPAAGNIQFYLENTADVTNLKSTTWTTTISTMTSVYNGSYAIPAAAGNVDLTLTTPFVYTGGSLYVAYDYLGTSFTTTGAVYFANSVLAGGWKGQVSATTTPPATLSATSAFRPNFRFTFTNPFVNELNVTGIAGEKGIFNNTISQAQTVTSIISNTSQGDLSNVPVTLSVTGANPYTVTQTIPSITSGGTYTLLFNNVPTISLGAQTITVTIPADENNTNNSRTFTQQVQCDTIGYAQSPVASGGVGFNTGAGLIAVRHVIPTGIETYVRSVSNYFPTAANNAGNTLKGILMDGSGTIIDSTALITITAGMLGTKQNFDFLNGNIDVSGDTIYVGFRQTANTVTGYFPFANQNNSYVDPNAAATFNLFGGGTSPLGSTLGYMMIEAALTFGSFDVDNSSNAGVVCLNSALDITPIAGYTNYEFFVNGSSVQNGATASYTTAPLTADMTFNVNIANGTCALSSNVQNINVFLASGTDTRAACNSLTWIDGNTYTANNNTATFTIVGGASNGCDSLVTLDLTINPFASSTDTRTACNSLTWIDGNTYTASNNTATFTYLAGSFSGCDSIVTLNLTINNPTAGTDTRTACGSLTWIDGNTYTANNNTATFTVVGGAANGCDSVVTLNLTINNPTAGTDTRTACGSLTWIDGNTYTANNNTATFTVVGGAANGCDSVVTLNLTINSVADVSVTNVGETITANNTNATYQWLDCNNNFAVISGQTSAQFTATANGSYAVQLTQNGCVDTSACTVITTVGVTETGFGAGLVVYPNPTKGTVSIDGLQSATPIRILSSRGEIVAASVIEPTDNRVDFSQYPAGVYYIQLGDKTLKVLKQ